MQHRRKNRILSLRDEGGNWYYDQKENIFMITDFFEKLFITSQDLSHLKYTPMFHYATLEGNDQLDLSLEPSIFEIRRLSTLSNHIKLRDRMVSILYSTKKFGMILRTI